MRHVVAVLRFWQWLLCDCLILLRHSRLATAERDFSLTLEDKQILARELTDQIATEWNICALETQTCAVAQYGHDLAVIFKNLRDKFDSCLGEGCDYLQTNCNLFWDASFEPLNNLRQTCGTDFPPSCQNLYILMNNYRDSEEYGLSVLCSLIQPGDNQVRKPHCRALARSTTAKETSLADCSGMAYDTCVTYFCNLYSDFFWRMRPSNMQKAAYMEPLTLWDDSYVLQGCESVIDTPFDQQECSNRRDIKGICSCLCQEFPNMPTGPASYECPAAVDSYLLFGRFNVEGVELDAFCEDSICQLLSDSRFRCPTMELPDVDQCKALQIPAMSSDPDMENCPWLTDSGEDEVLECLDGYRCNVNTDSWACCFAHLGRARCPRDQPKMCNILCSGSPTEFCCEEAASKCDPRPCSPVLVNKPWTIPATTQRSTTPLPITRSSSDEGGFTIRLPPGSWVWLLLIIPFFLGIGCVCLWRRWYRASQFQVPPKEIAVEDIDVSGRFHRVKKVPGDDELPKKNKLRVPIIVEELPETKPLGLELYETKVNRVHPAGATYGWQVGDKIIQIGGMPVSTFEEIWERIQIERDRLPCTFVVEREVQAPTYIDNIRGQQRRHEDRHSRASTKEDRYSRATTKEASGRIADSRTASNAGSRVGSRAASKLADSDSAPPGSTRVSRLLGDMGAFDDDRSSRFVGRSKSMLSSTSRGTGGSDHLDPVAREQERRKLERFQHLLGECGFVDCNRAADTEIDLEAVASQLALAVKERDRKHVRHAIEEAVIAGLPAVEVKAAQDVLLELDQAHRMDRRRARTKAQKGDSDDEDDEDKGPEEFSIEWWLERADVPMDEGALESWEQWQLQLEDVAPEPPVIPDWQLQRNKGFTMAKTFEESKPYHAWLHSAQELVRSQAPEATWRKCAGYIDESHDMRRARMTVEEAKLVCTRIGGCRGFSHAGPATSEPVEIVFKNSNIVHKTPETQFTTWLKPEVNLRPESVGEDRKKPVDCSVCGGPCSRPVEPEVKAEDIGKRYCEVCQKEVADKSILYGGFRGPDNEIYHPHCLKEQVGHLHGAIGVPTEWICNVCGRGNKIEAKADKNDRTDPTCSVCGTKHGYTNTKLDRLAMPTIEMHEQGKKKTLDPRVRFKKDAMGRFVYDIMK